jgi:manganese-dependent ADP-ribose/CDP-alcohol diphosphatase
MLRNCNRCDTASHKRKEAVRLLTEKKPNYPNNENSLEALDGRDRRFVAFGGAVGTRQLVWLRDTLDHAVMNISHQPIHPDSSHSTCLMWNYKDILDILRDNKDVVLASFAGHAHKGGYH